MALLSFALMRHFILGALALASSLVFGCTEPRDASYEISAHVVDAAGKPASGQVVDLFAGRYDQSSEEPTFEASNFYTTDATGTCGPLRFGTNLTGGEVVEASAIVRGTGVGATITISYDEVGDDRPTIQKTIELVLP